MWPVSETMSVSCPKLAKPGRLAETTNHLLASSGAAAPAYWRRKASPPLK